MSRFVILLLVLFSVASCYRGPECIIEGSLENVEDGTVMMLVTREGNTGRIAARDTVSNGRFRFSYLPQSGGTEFVALMADPRMRSGFPSTRLELYIAPGKTIRVKGEDKLIFTWEVRSSIPEQKYRNRLVDTFRDLMDEEQQLLIDYDDLRLKRDAAESAGERAVYVDSITSLMARKSVLDDSMNVKRLQFLAEMPVNEVWLREFELHAGMVKAYPGYKYTEQLRTLYKRLSDEQMESENGQKIAAMLFPPKMVGTGDRIADGDLYDVDGNLHHLSEYEGKYLLLDFWSSGCGPCRQAMPEMHRLSEELKDKVAIISISEDTEKVWKETSEVENISWTNLNDLQGRTGIFAHYDTAAIPYYVIVSPEGVILHAWKGYANGIIESKLREIL